MAEPSGSYKAGTILLLVGAILSAVGAAFILLAGLFLMWLGNNFDGEGGSRMFPGNVVASIYMALGAVMIVGSAFGFLGHAAARRGDAHDAWVKGLVCALVPPLQVVPLIGAILLLTSPEHEASKGKR